jgi:hypothetical protein
MRSKNEDLCVAALAAGKLAAERSEADKPAKCDLAHKIVNFAILCV